MDKAYLALKSLYTLISQDSKVPRPKVRKVLSSFKSVLRKELGKLLSSPTVGSVPAGRSITLMSIPSFIQVKISKTLPRKAFNFRNNKVIHLPSRLKVGIRASRLFQKGI